MKSLIQIIFYLLFLNTIYANSISGIVVDNQDPLYGATVVVLEKSDSTMVAFGLTDDSGKFVIHDIPDGSFVLQVSYTGFQEYYQAFDLLSSTSPLDLGLITLNVSNAVLQEVSIEAERIPMGILGDTINYNAAAFKTREGASVEDLLKKMPGIEVARDGSIKAQGEDVENVLVDGKEFFSGDPTMATKNLEAEAIDKVQVYDKQSEEAEFTGIADGQEEKTINLKLKEDYKNGGFGKVALEGGTEDTRLSKVNYNRFSPSIQASIIGNSNNINEQAFSFNDYIQFMGGFGNVMNNGGFQNSELFNSGRGPTRGIVDQDAIGTNLNLDVNSKTKVNFNYLFSGQDKLLNELEEAVNYTDVEEFNTRDSLNANSDSYSHRASFKLDYKKDPRNEITLKSNFSYVNNTDVESAMTRYLRNEILQTSTTNDLDKDVVNRNWNTDLIYKRKFGAKGRNWINSINIQKAKQSEDLFIDNTIVEGFLLDRVIQIQNLDGTSSNYSFSSKYKEPVGKGMYLGVHYSILENTQNPERSFFNKVGQEFNLDTSLSDEFTRSWNTQTFGLSFRRNKKKVKLATSLSYQFTDLSTFQLSDNTNTSMNNNYLLPRATLDWDLKGAKRMEFHYSTNVTAPSIGQIITIPNNANPNYLVLGNSSLSPEYIHTIGGRYSSFDQFNFSNFFVSLDVSSSKNKIVNAISFNPDFTTVVQPINARDYYSTRLYLGHSRPIRPLKVKYSINSNVTSEHYQTELNSATNKISSWNLDTNLRIENRNKEKIDVAGGFKFIANDYRSSFNSNSTFVNYSWYTDAAWNMSPTVFVSATYDYQTFDASFTGDNEVQHLVNLSLRKSFLKGKLALEFIAHDVFNETTGIFRYGSQTSLVDSRFNTLARYFMAGVSYRIGTVKETGISFSE